MPMDVLARDEAEATMLREAMKHKRGTKTLTIRVGTPEELLPTSAAWRE